MLSKYYKISETSNNLPEGEIPAYLLATLPSSLLIRQIND